MSGWAAILAAAAPEYEAFCLAYAHPRATQLALLRRILRANAQSAFGRAHDFARIDDIDGFRAAIPIRSYDELRPWIDRAAGGEPASSSKATSAEASHPSSGSGPAKLSRAARSSRCGAILRAPMPSTYRMARAAVSVRSCFTS